MKNLIVITVVALFIQGCATAYQKYSLTGGYFETQLDENIFKVSFRGNGYTSRERVIDFTFLRSAELALENGFQYFAIIDATPKKSYTTGNAYGSDNYAYDSTTTITTGGQTYRISIPSSSNTIVCFKEKPEIVFIYNANLIYKNIKQKYDIKEAAK